MLPMMLFPAHFCLLIFDNKNYKCARVVVVVVTSCFVSVLIFLAVVVFVVVVLILMRALAHIYRFVV